MDRPEAEPPDEDLPPWSPAEHVVWSQRTGGGHREPTAVLLQHPAHPYRRTVAQAAEETLQHVAYDYLKEAMASTNIEPRFALPQSWIDGLDPDRRSAEFGWMPIDWPPNAGVQQVSQPYGSFRAITPAASDFVVALFGSERLEKDVFRGSGFGLRVVLHVRPAYGRFELTIDGMSACVPFIADEVVWSDDLKRVALVIDFLNQREKIASLTHLVADSLVIRGVRLGKITQAPGSKERLRFQVRGIGVRCNLQTDARPTPFAFAIQVVDGESTGRIERTPLIADGAGDARVFVRDPASQEGAEPASGRRPTRTEKELDHFREEQTVTGKLTARLRDGKRLMVMPSTRFVLADRHAEPNRARRITLPGTGGPAVRSDDASSVQALVHPRELYRRLEAYGIDPVHYFRIVKPKIRVYYRSGISPGPGKSGQTVNARVLPFGWKPSQIGRIDLKARPLLEMHLGLANLSHRARKPWTQGGPRVAAEPLGIGADARWMWHEFGHVLLMATMGELELRFAHSPGDALAAIVADPENALHGPRRFSTFPWVFLPRRHDRCPSNGWSWGGTMHAELARVSTSALPRRKGYASEQILSSALFRLYRCLGGDTAHDAPVGGPKALEIRQGASHYGVYLIMRALQLLGDALVTQTDIPEQLVLALIGADKAVDRWTVSYPAGAKPSNRVAGCAVKPIRWAFEAQGLYVAAGDDGNAPGAPPPVDIYIASRRPDVESTPQGTVTYGPGNYLPVSLHWQSAANPSVPDWQASGAALTFDAAGKVHVAVGNRGQKNAVGVEVAVWFAPVPTRLEDSRWLDGSWTRSGTTEVAKTVAAGATVAFGPYDLGALPPGNYLVMAIAHCASDPANTDPTTGLACSLWPTRLVDLVSGDNNLALCVRTVPTPAGP